MNKILENIQIFIGHIVSVLLVYHDKYHLEKLRKKSDIHKSVRVGRFSRFPGSGKVIIKEGSYIGINCFLEAHPHDTKILIGKNCALAHGIQIRTIGYDSLENQSRKEFGDVIIGDNVWIGSNVYIKGGVRIGNGAKIGANAVVLKDVPDGATAVGIPARILNEKRNNK
jgi:maltose O-acetyltransferase